MRTINETHDAQLKSWVESANDPASDFPIQNLPYCRFAADGEGELRLGVAIGDSVLDLSTVSESGLLPEWAAEAIGSGSLNALMGLAVDARMTLRRRISRLLSAACRELQDHQLAQRVLRNRRELEFHLPCHIGDYTDFYASIDHATSVGSMFRPDNPLLPNYKFIPIGYHGRASSLVISGTDVRRPFGQLPPATDGEAPSFGPCKNLDYELEVGAFIAQGNELGQPIPIRRAEDCLFGICLVNDWSARDIQRWEYQPLGPFLAKSFATSLSPWVVTMEALVPFRCPMLVRPDGDPKPLPYLDHADNQERGGIDVKLAVFLQTEQMRKSGMEPHRISSGDFRRMYWTLAQMLTHHTSNGCNLHPGDLIASGTVSGPERGSRGCLLELTWDGEPGKPVPGTQRTPLKLPGGETRTFLQDGDDVIFRGWCESPGFRRIGLGECRGRIVPAHAR
jgi:fumarylacetoacetase